MRYQFPNNVYSFQWISFVQILFLIMLKSVLKKVQSIFMKETICFLQMNLSEWSYIQINLGWHKKKRIFHVFCVIKVLASFDFKIFVF